MKKFTFLMVVFLFAFNAQAQFSVTSNMGDIEEGTVFVAENTDEEDASIFYEIHNNSTFPINMRLYVVGFDNTDGENFELCLGGADQCYFKVVSETGYPINSFVTISPGQVQVGAGDDHLWNRREHGTVEGEDISYYFQFQQVDAAGEEVLDTMDFTYVFSPTMGVEDFGKKFGVEILNTLITNGKLNIQAQEPAHIEIFNLLGQQVKNTKLNVGMNTMDVSNLSSQIYLVRMQNEQGEIKTQKIVVD